MDVHELALGDHSRFPAHKSQALQSWLDGVTDAALLWSYKGGDFDPHPGFVALFTNANASDEDLAKLRQVLAKILPSNSVHNGDLVDGCTVCFAPTQAGPLCAILILKGEDCGLVTGQGMIELHQEALTEANQPRCDAL